MQEAQADPAYDGAAPPPALAAARAATATTGFVTPAGIAVSRVAAPFDPALLASLTRQVDERRGGVLSSGMEYPGRYSRWHVAYVDPCVEIVARGRRIAARALNGRGAVLLPVIGAALRRASGTSAGNGAAPAGPGARAIEVLIPEPGRPFTEEERSRRPTVFSALREIVAAFAGPDEHLGLYGAFGYDLAFQFEPVRLRHERDDRQRTWSCTCPTSLRAGPQAGDRAALLLRLRGGLRQHGWPPARHRGHASGVYRRAATAASLKIRTSRRIRGRVPMRGS
jgi:hypothetical protein